MEAIPLGTHKKAVVSEGHAAREVQVGRNSGVGEDAEETARQPVVAEDGIVQDARDVEVPVRPEREVEGVAEASGARSDEDALESTRGPVVPQDLVGAAAGDEQAAIRAEGEALG